MPRSQQGGGAVTRIDWDAMLAGLEQQKAGLEQEVADVDAVIHAVRQRAAPKVSIADVQRPRANGSKKSGAGKVGSNTRASSEDTDKAKAAAKKRYERGDGVNDIAKDSGRSVQTIYGWASAGAWKRPNPGAAASPAAAAPTESKRETLPGKVRCTSCDLWTEHDPCDHCGKKLKRNW